MYKKKYGRIKSRPNVKKTSGKDDSLELLLKNTKDKKTFRDISVFKFKYWGNIYSINIKKIDIISNSPILIKGGNSIEIKFTAIFDVIYNNIRTEKIKYFTYKKKLRPNGILESNHSLDQVLYNIDIQCISLDFQNDDKNSEVFCKFQIQYKINYYE